MGCHVKPLSDDRDSFSTEEGPSAGVNGRDVTASDDHLGTNILFIDRFPKEFQRNFFETLDRRFYAILLVTLFVAVSVLFTLAKRTPDQYDSDVITQIQQQYIDLLLRYEQVYPAPVDPGEYLQFIGPIDYETITGLSRWLEDVAGAATLEIFDLPGTDTKSDIYGMEVREGTTGLSHEEMDAAHQSGAEDRQKSRAMIEESVSDVGLLALITRDESSLSEEEVDYIDDLLQYADVNSARFVDILTKLNSIRVARGDRPYTDARTFRGHQEDVGRRLIGGHKEAEKEVSDFLNSIDRIEKAAHKAVSRRSDYEKINPSSKDMLVRPEELPPDRDIADVVEVVKRHLTAIQYCYNRELKSDSTLKGTILVRFIVNPDGHVIEAAIVSSTLNNQRAETCMLDKIMNWNDFPPIQPSSGNITYKQSFNFGT